MNPKSSVTDAHAHQKAGVPVAVIVFTVAYFAATSVSAIVNDNQALVPYVLTLAVLGTLVFFVHLHTNLSRPVLWCLSVWGLAHLCGGLVQIPKFWPYNPSSSVLYSLWFIPDKLRYDQVVHAFGFGITVQLSWELLRNVVQNRYGVRLTPRFGIVAICVLAGSGFGALNEVVEFAGSSLLTHVDAGGYWNLSWDLVYNTLGTVVAGIILYCRGRFREPAGR